ncbi:hypothetical protein SLA2020_241420 [Shorea laevis]
MEAQKNLEENLQQLSNREHELNEQEAQIQARLKKICYTSGQHKEELAQLKKELRAMQEKHLDFRSKYKMLKSRISDIENHLHELKAERYETERMLSCLRLLRL